MKIEIPEKAAVVIKEDCEKNFICKDCPFEKDGEDCREKFEGVPPYKWQIVNHVK